MSPKMKKRKERENCCCLINFSSKHELPCVLFKRTSYTAKNKRQKSENNKNQENFDGIEECRPSAKNIVPNFLLDATLVGYMLQIFYMHKALLYD